MEHKKQIINLDEMPTIPIEEHEGEVPYCGLSISKKVGEIPQDERKRIQKAMEKSGLIQD